MIRNKINKIVVCALIVTTMSVVNNTIVFASETKDRGVNIEERVGITLNDGKYAVKNKTSYVDPSNTVGQSMARRALKENTNFSIKDGKIKMTLFLNESLFIFMGNVKVSLENQDLNGVIDKNNKSITFDIPSLEKEVKVDMFITIMNKNVTFLVNNQLNTVKPLN